MNELLVAGIVNLARSIAGWLENSLKDGKIQAVEWAKLGSTTIRQAMYTGIIFFGGSAVGINADLFSSAVAASFLSYVEHMIPKKEE